VLLSLFGQGLLVAALFSPRAKEALVILKELQRSDQNVTEIGSSVQGSRDAKPD
jgi:hypothetical protein